jgi:capsular polysaccharide biosynthesis protein
LRATIVDASGATMMNELSADDRQFIEELSARKADEVPLIGALFADMNFKRAMVERFGVQQAFEFCRQHLAVPDLGVLRRRRVVSLRSVAERGEAFRELWPGGRAFSHPVPKVIGEGDHSEQSGVSRSAYLACLRDVLVRGRSAVVLLEDVAAVDIENGESQGLQDNPEFDPAVLHAAEDHFWTLEPESSPREIDEAFMLVGTYAHDFGHWLSEHLPKLAIARMAGLADVPLLIDRRIPDAHRQSLALFCPNSEVLSLDHLASCRVRKLWCAPNPMYRPFSPANWSDAWQRMLPDPENFAHAIQALKSTVESALAEPTGVDRIFLARRPHRKKRLVNHDRIAEIAAGSGFRTVYPEDLPFAEQLRLVHHARYLIAPDGSNGLLCYFVSPGASVCFLNHGHTRPLVELNGQMASMGANFTIVTGPVAGEPGEEPFWNDYRIDEKVFESFLQTWLPQRDRAVL